MDNISRKYKNLLISILAAFLLVIACVLLYYPSRSGLGETFGLSILYILARHLILALGIVVLLLRLVKLLRNSEVLLYILIGTWNFLMGISGFVLYLRNEIDTLWFYNCLVNMLIGTIVLVDVFVISRSESLHNNGTKK